MKKTKKQKPNQANKQKIKKKKLTKTTTKQKTKSIVWQHSFLAKISSHWGSFLRNTGVTTFHLSSPLSWSPGATYPSPYKQTLLFGATECQEATLYLEPLEMSISHLSFPWTILYPLTCFFLPFPAHNPHAFTFPSHSSPKSSPAPCEGLLCPITDHRILLILCTQFETITDAMQIEAFQGIRLNTSCDFQLTFHWAAL